ncbi:hypothetical protein ACJIZ3_016448 [Penstemon smallii]|uniref:Uncharacterized protein n=1 Tax=Penstemon smallii TaxID=265156 RepID=A0ABD3RQF0_9LAMI
MEKEKQAQRELQRELEQMESGPRPSRREFASSSHSRARDRYRERENSSRESNEGNLRTNTRIMQHDTTIPTSPVVLTGTRSFQNQVPTILQSRERSEDCSSNYEENVDGSKDSGDTGSVGDPDIAEGQSSNLARHGSRGSSKSRQIIDRRERDGRREGKWERKH